MKTLKINIKILKLKEIKYKRSLNALKNTRFSKTHKIGKLNNIVNIKVQE